MDPHEVAPILGMSANGVAALSYRAREGLRKAWLQAHVSEPGVSEACKWTIGRLGDNARHSLTAREQEKLSDHLKTCAKCAIVSEEVNEVGSHLAMVLLPIMLGAGVGGILLASLTHGGAASAAAVSAAAIAGGWPKRYVLPSRCFRKRFLHPRAAIFPVTGATRDLPPPPWPSFSRPSGSR